MKLKSVLVVALLAAFSTVGFSQIRYGAKLGVNLSSMKLSFDSGMDFGSRVSPVLGGFAEYDLSDKFALQAELVYSMEGSSVSGTMAEWDGDELVEYEVDGKYKLDYLNIPLLAKYKFGNGLSLLAGPQFGFLMSAKAGDEDFEDVKDDFNGMNTSLAIGAAYELESGLGFDLRYNMGLSNIGKDMGDETLKLNTIQISAFYKF
jgi:hypothetical protein